MISPGNIGCEKKVHSIILVGAEGCMLLSCLIHSSASTSSHASPSLYRLIPQDAIERYNVNVQAQFVHRLPLIGLLLMHNMRAVR